METNETAMKEILFEALEIADYRDSVLSDIRDFQNAGVLTNNEGLVVRLSDGSEFQVTIVQSKGGRS